MSRIKSKGSALERLFEGALRKTDLKYRKHVSSLPGKPDFVFTDKKVAVFIDSCFWHGCRYHGTFPKSNRCFWLKKISRNKTRDREVSLEYKKIGWSVIRVWEHKLDTISDRAFGGIINKVLK